MGQAYAGMRIGPYAVIVRAAMNEDVGHRGRRTCIGAVVRPYTRNTAHAAKSPLVPA